MKYEKKKNCVTGFKKWKASWSKMYKLLVLILLCEPKYNLIQSNNIWSHLVKVNQIFPYSEDRTDSGSSSREASFDGMS